MNRPDFQAPSFQACYRHPDRFTGIRCQRCGKPICGECMQPASVGFQCPSCARSGRGSGRASVRAPRTVFGGALSAHGGTVTKVLIGIVIGLWVLGLISRGLVDGLLAMSGPAVLSGQVWRLVTYGFTSGGLINTLFISLILWAVGRPLEEQFGALRYLVLYVLGGVGGAVALFVASPGVGGALGGASPAAIGLIAVHTVIKLRRREDIRPDLGLFAVLILLNLVIGWGSVGWLSLVGGIVVGALAAAALVFPGRARRNQLQVLGLLGVMALCIAAVVLRTMVGYA